MQVKFILPALTEAKSPYWRPIKYSLFPPLGLATLAAYLAPDDEAILQDEHIETLSLDAPPDSVVIQVYIHYQCLPGLPNCRPLPEPRRIGGFGRLARKTELPILTA